jgi:dipeptidyl aminopeptidase/acylaminoacyl peptidase
MRLLRTAIAAALALAAATTLPSPAEAQGTAADYLRAQALREQYQQAAVGMADAATWIRDAGRFWYRKTVKGGHEFVLVEAASGEKRPAFDHAKLAAGLSKVAGRTIAPHALPFNAITFVEKESAVEATFDGANWRCSLADYACTRTERTGAFERRQPAPPCTPPGPEARPVRSPDAALEAFVANYNVVIRAVGTREWARLSTDGSEGNCYELESVRWSPDSKKLIAFRVVPGYRRAVHYVESSPEDQLQPKHSSRFYAKPGDVLDLERPVLFHAASKRQLAVDDALFRNPYDLSTPVWRRDSSAFTFEFNERGHRRFRVVEVNAETGQPRAVITEDTQTFFCYSSKRYRRDIQEGKEVIWMSERDGWNHLYLYDGATGEVKNQITKGPWVVRAVAEVDEARRQIYFSASGMYPGKDPYFVHYYRINFDGTGLVPLTTADANHTVSFSSNREFYVDHYSRVDLAPVMEVRKTADSGPVGEGEPIERGDLAALQKAGWRPPEVFTSLARDGKSEIWGVIYRPTTLDPKRKYPVIENIYAGPHSSFVPKSFSAFNAMQAQAEIGFIVVQIDGMGTSNRSKAFHDVAWQNLGDAGFPDRILWHKAVAAKYPWYDASRVGIYGTSAGGQNSLGGLLFHPAFYKAAVSAAGCHDNRMDKIWWNEQWMGWPIGPHYAAASNVDNAYRLEGNLLLVVGEMDTNVDPSSTMQVVNQLIRRNKPFDLLVVPGGGHGAGGAYGEHKRYDFFVQHLLGVTPPAWKSVEPPKPPAK